MDNYRERILNFLQWCDRHGCYTDDECDIEGFDRLTYEDAEKFFFGFLNEQYYCTITDNIFELTHSEVIQIAKNQGFYYTTKIKLNQLLENENPTIDFYKQLLN